MMTRIIPAMLACILSLQLVTLSGCGSKDAPSRAIEFTTSYLSGETLNENEWFASAAQKSDFFEKFGGLENLSLRGREASERNGGLKKVEVIEARKTGKDRQSIKVRAVFGNGESLESEEAWIYEEGKWRVTPPPARGKLDTHVNLQ